MAFVRLVPVFPFNFLNYALGLTKIKCSHYFITTYIDMLPGEIAYTYLGYASCEAIIGADGLVQKIMRAFALLAIVGFFPSLIGRLLRRIAMTDVNALHQNMGENADVLLLDVRTSRDYVGEQGHIQNSVSIPVEELEKRLTDIDDFQEKTVMTICPPDKRSTKAAQILTRHGFTDVHIIRGAMTAWHGLPPLKQMNNRANKTSTDVKLSANMSSLLCEGGPRRKNQ